MKFIISLIITALFVFSIGCESKKQETQNPNLPPQQTLKPPQQQQRVIQKQQNIDPKIAKEVLAVVYENLEATKAEDKERVLATIHKDSPQYSSTLQGLDFVFVNYDLDLNLEKAEVINLLENDAQVYYVQTIKTVAGTGFMDKRDEGIHHLKKDNAEWKIFRTENINTTPLR
ncbi:MAG: hypothetical protein KJN64_14595 [Ignavibacteria bacterium]|nr:hypothetical protein [Ignavibacteria bacterium]MBT8380921.1 hypothetical protein [Ignavibacteria bacterium]MBT8391485.1 hypothetical protein [Ignavibacteria bacterium]NNJ54148.1 hypothetical protein [Ignavibacteriaceae bacterium]NNL20655.1 hypothetical protein [Ignavibacteriaceae bacterium]